MDLHSDFAILSVIDYVQKEMYLIQLTERLSNFRPKNWGVYNRPIEEQSIDKRANMYSEESL